MKHARIPALLLAAALLAGSLTGCTTADSTASSAAPSPAATPAGALELASDKTLPAPDVSDAVHIALADEATTVDGLPISADPASAVYAANDIVYYEAGHDFTYGEGTDADAHTRDEADAHLVVHITRPGTYRLSGSLSAGQVAIDLGKDAEDDPEAVVNLVLDGADITCTVAPAVIFYNVYECADKDAPSPTPDTSKAGANVVIADGSKNHIIGSYVARIYKSIELNDAGTQVVDSKKLHKYDGAFYSKMSMNLFGGPAGTGLLDITAENEGLDSEMHLSLNGGSIRIHSGNDGINTNEDGVSVTTVNAGTLDITVTGETGEGDGIDSNGWVVINGGQVSAWACAKSADAGIDSDMGIYLNGGIVAAAGSMLDAIEADSTASYTVFHFAERQTGGQTYTLKDPAGQAAAQTTPANDFSILVVSAPALVPGDYTLWQGATQLSGTAGQGGFGPGGFGGMGGQRPGNMQPPAGFAPGDLPDDFDPDDLPDAFAPGQRPQRPEGDRPPDGTDPAQNGRPDRGERPGNMQGGGESSTTFAIVPGGNFFTGVCPVTFTM